MNNSNDNLSFWKIFQPDIGLQSKKLSGYIYGFVCVCVYVTKYLFNVTFIACDIEQKTLLYLFLRFCYLLFCCHWYISPLLYLFNKKSFCFSTFVIAYRSKESLETAVECFCINKSNTHLPSLPTKAFEHENCRTD